jgi:carboxymethylenebutenolidase
MGFSMGAYYALWLVEQAALPVTATVLFYGTRGGDYAATPSAFLGHFAESDEWVAASGVKKLEKALRAAGKEVDFHTYPGTSHWFFESDRPDAFSPQAADLAWQRTVAFLHRLVS